MWFQKQMCKTGNSDFNKSTPFYSSETCGFDEKGSFFTFFWTPLTKNTESRILSLFPLANILGLLKGSNYLCTCVYTVKLPKYAACRKLIHSNEAQPCSNPRGRRFPGFTRRSCSLWDYTVGAPISARFHWKKQSESELTNIPRTLPGYTVSLEKKGHLVCICPQMHKWQLWN